jgi:hypothetical protein
MRRLIYLLLLVGLLTSVGCRRNKTIQYVRVVEDSAAAAANDIPKASDPFEDSEGDDTWANDEGVMEIPEIPQERSVNMNANDYELEKMLKGR